MTCGCKEQTTTVEGDTEITLDHKRDAQLAALILVHKESVRQSRMLFNYSNPVDEYFSTNGNVIPGQANIIQPNYEISVRIDSVTASLPIGMTSALLQFGGDRTIVLYSGAATTQQTLVNLTGLGIIINRDDARTLTIAGAPASGTFIALAGFALERYGNQ